MRLTHLMILNIILYYLCACDSGSNTVIDNTQNPQEEQAEERCYKFGIDGLDESFTLFIRKKEITGSGKRFIHETSKSYKLNIKGSFENENTIKVNITAVYKRDEGEQLSHSETWTLAGNKLYIKNRTLSGFKGDFEVFQINCKGSTQKDPKLYDYIDGFYNGFAVVQRDTNLGLINIQEEEKFMLPSRFAGLEIVNENSIVYYDSEAMRYGMLDTNGTILLQPIYARLHCFNEGLAAFLSKEGKWGFIDRSGKVVIEPQFTSMAINDKIPSLHPFNDGLAAVGTDKGWGYINTEGDVVIPFDLVYAGPFKNGEARVNSAEKGWFYIDTSGKCIEDCE
ncbi:MAG: WG repeat-containing protein [Saprospiraceae bacterium]|nr:WG repeat-containing protein [Saprospiraceae bacterium]